MRMRATERPVCGGFRRMLGGGVVAEVVEAQGHLRSVLRGGEGWDGAVIFLLRENRGLHGSVVRRVSILRGTSEEV